jgi:hypothetical protein
MGDGGRARHGRPRAAGRVSAPGEAGGRVAARRRRLEERCGVADVTAASERAADAASLRIADTHLPGEERKTTKHTGRYPCGSRARLFLAGDAPVGTGEGCRQEVRRGPVRAGA